MNTKSSSIFSTAGLLAAMLAAGCAQEVAASEQPPKSTAPTETAAAAAKVSKIVFVGKQKACDCTRERVQATWVALQKALGTPAKLPVERLQIDTEGSKVEPYRKQRPMMALPAIYFVDAKGKVLNQLQGEVAEEQIRAAIGQQ